MQAGSLISVTLPVRLASEGRGDRGEGEGGEGSWSQEEGPFLPPPCPPNRAGMVGVLHFPMGWSLPLWLRDGGFWGPSALSPCLAISCHLCCYLATDQLNNSVLVSRTHGP